MIPPFNTNKELLIVSNEFIGNCFNHEFIKHLTIKAKNSLANGVYKFIVFGCASKSSSLLFDDGTPKDVVDTDIFGVEYYLEEKIHVCESIISIKSFHNEVIETYNKNEILKEDIARVSRLYSHIIVNYLKYKNYGSADKIPLLVNITNFFRKPSFEIKDLYLEMNVFQKI